MPGVRSHDPLPPYLGSWALASLAFTSPIVLALLLTIIRLILAINSANASIASAKQSLASSCNGLEQAASLAVSFPHFMAANMNNATADSAEALIHGLGAVLDMSVLGLEQITLFVVDTYRSMYLCLAELVVRGGMALAIGATEEFSEFLTSTFSTIRTDVQKAISGFDSLLDDAIETVNKLPGVDITPPDISVPNLDFLNNVTLPSEFIRGLSSLNNSMPTLDELRQKMNAIISIPFEELRSEINGSLRNATIDRSLFPVPQREYLAFCQDLDTSFVDNVGHTLVKVAQYGIIAICVFILLFIAAMVLQERIGFRSLVEYVNDSRNTWMTDMTMAHESRFSGPFSASVGRADIDRTLSAPTLLGFITASNNPILRRIMYFMNKIPAVRRSPRTRSNLAWFIAYITYLPALLLLLVVLLGLITIEIQLAALKPTEKTAQGQVEQGLSGFRSQVLAKVNNATLNSSMAYSMESNSVLSSFENGINNGMFGWVNTTTVTLNTTINEFYSELTGAINDTFGGTVFESPAMTVVNCLIGNKIAGLSTALTWMHKNAHVNLPKVPNDVFQLSDGSSQELVASLDSPTEPGSSTSSSIVQKLVAEYRKALEKERIGFLFLLGLYGLVVLIGALAVLWHEVVWPKWRARHPKDTIPPKELQLEKSATIAMSRSPQASERAAVWRRFGALGASLAHRVRGRRQPPSNDDRESFFGPMVPMHQLQLTTSDDSAHAHQLELSKAASPPPAYPSAAPATMSTSQLLQPEGGPRRPSRSGTFLPSLSFGRGQDPFQTMAYEAMTPYHSRQSRSPEKTRQPATQNPFATPFDAPHER